MQQKIPETITRYFQSNTLPLPLCRVLFINREKDHKSALLLLDKRVRISATDNSGRLVILAQFLNEDDRRRIPMNNWKKLEIIQDAYGAFIFTDSVTENGTIDSLDRRMSSLATRNQNATSPYKKRKITQSTSEEAFRAEYTVNKVFLLMMNGEYTLKPAPHLEKLALSSKPTLVVNMQYTLVVITTEPISHEAVLFENIKYYIKMRPGVREFLDSLQDKFNLVLFSDLAKPLTNYVINMLEADKKYFSCRLYEEHTKLWIRNHVKEEMYCVKQVELMANDLDKVVVLESNIAAIPGCWRNGFVVSKFDGDEHDTALNQVLPILISLTRVQDVRKFLPNYLPRVNCAVMKLNYTLAERDGSKVIQTAVERFEVIY